MISFVYFDVGGVVLKDFSASNKWDLLRKDLGISDDNKAAFANLWRRYEREICTTKNVESMIPLLEEECYAAISNSHSLLENFIKYFEKNESMWRTIGEVKAHCRIGLLTNMYVGMFDEISKANILPPVSWDVIIDSSVVKAAKPDKKIFEIAQEKAQVSANTILFVENTMKNIEVAHELGWQTFFYDSSDYRGSSQKLHEYFLRD